MSEKSPITKHSRYLITMGEKTYAVPVGIIATHRTMTLNNTLVTPRTSVCETMELFQDPHEVRNWASENMCWSDVKEHAVLVFDETEETDYDEYWISSGEWDIER